MCGKNTWLRIALLVLLLPVWAAAGTTELATGWRMTSARNVEEQGGETISRPSYDASRWYGVARMPATVLQVLEDNQVYPNLYFGKNMTSNVPRDLFRQDWWYRTTFTAPAGSKMQWLNFKGVNYRAEIWLNGERIATNKQIVGMYNEFELNVTGKVKPGEENVLAVKVTPEQALQDVDGVELADSWFDWINSKYLGIRLIEQQIGISYPPDRNAGVWKKVFLRTSDAVTVRNPYVVTDLPLPAKDPATLTVYCDVKNGAAAPVSGTLMGEITREGKAPIRFEQPVALAANETREVAFSAGSYQQLVVKDPDLWWPYQWGAPNLYQLKLEFKIGGGISDTATTQFGIRKITQHRDTDTQFPELGGGGNFYFQVNGVDFLARGADYAPDFLFRYDEGREESILRYVKDMGLNLLRWESKISSEHIIELADREGVPVMLGWMCCNQWEKWDQWDAEDHRVARESLRSQIRMLRAHPSVFMWASGSDGLPPTQVRNDYHQILRDLHWQNAVVDTVSSFNKDASGKTVWDGIRMQGPYSWRPPAYWFSGKYSGTIGSCAEQGDNESIPPYESLKKFIPQEKLWPINDWWYYHAGTTDGNNTLSTITKAVDIRYGTSSSAEEFAEKAQIAHYENTRAHFETYASRWQDHKMTLYWMLNSQWPNFFGHIIDYYLKPGGAYYGAKKGLRPLNIVFDYYATGDRSQAYVRVTNQTLATVNNLNAVVSIVNLDGTVKYSDSRPRLQVAPNSAVLAFTLPRVKDVSSAYFVRCQLKGGDGKLIAENVYWQSTTDDDLGAPENENAFILTQNSWADMTALNQMAPATLSATSHVGEAEGWTTVSVTLANKAKAPAFFVRAEVVNGKDGDEVLPVTWDDNYATIFGGETITLQARYQTAALAGKALHLRLQGHNVQRQVIALQ
ncbi:MAG: beta galactosidase jelly roll domain-containing protein [Acidobacteria bacterium]|nr:beta galactosidase jelly roll domain-containing protein [Acidobacteriota bacterium]